MKRTLISLVVATFALAAGSSFAQTTPAAAPVEAKMKTAKPVAKHSKAHKTTKHKVASHKAGKVHVAHKKAAKSPAAA